MGAYPFIVISGSSDRDQMAHVSLDLASRAFSKRDPMEFLIKPAIRQGCILSLSYICAKAHALLGN
jgi:hypothetical protein